ncbi:hypothetical protein [Streptomyces sp. NPDC020681]|uniref:hypothetical protein n=1 Tax=Streptomyces sp. NPDC020681 TaxID=3365083 RepID=UPI0037BB199E
MRNAEWKAAPVNRSSPGSFGIDGSAMGPLASMSDVRRQPTGAGLDPPSVRHVVPRGLEQAAPEADTGQQIVLLGDPSQVVAKLRLRGEHVRPVRVRRDGQ